MTGREVLSIVKSEHLATPLIWDRELVMSAGTSGYSIISKDVMPETLVQSLRRVVEGETLLPVLPDRQVAFREQNSITQNVLTTLTDREHQIMRLVSEGLSNKEIGRRLQITHGTIKQHLHHIFQKLEISNRTVLAALAISASPGFCSTLVPADMPSPAPLPRRRCGFLRTMPRPCSDGTSTNRAISPTFE